MREAKAATIVDVAALAGVSKATVGRVIGNYGNVSQKSRERVLSAIDQLGYSQNAIAQGLRSKSTKTIGVVVGDITNNFCNRLLNAVERVALQKGYDVLFGNSAEDPAREVRLLSNLKARRVDGVVLISSVTDVSSVPGVYRELYTQLPIVLADRRVEGLDLDLITSDNEERGYAETRKLIDLGHERIGVIYYSQVSTLLDRHAGYLRAIRERGLCEDPRLTLAARDISDLSAQRIERFLAGAPGITAVMVFNNSILPHLLRAMNRRGLTAGRDLSVISWDDDDLNDLMGIDTVIQAVDQIGEMAVNRLFDRIEGRVPAGPALSLSLGTSYIERTSCRAPGGAGD